jgi:hypothetical protein
MSAEFSSVLSVAEHVICVQPSGTSTSASGGFPCSSMRNWVVSTRAPAAAVRTMPGEHRCGTCQRLNGCVPGEEDDNKLVRPTWAVNDGDNNKPVWPTLAVSALIRGVRLFRINRPTVANGMTSGPVIYTLSSTEFKGEKFRNRTVPGEVCIGRFV